ncbi:ArsR/SmtB family transcription factor [Alteripontixanthobacter maritimus]|uniref:ArsR/SmtB family transcription factor n=1 Tax=Alteripontixanthobacter maritimus TaxID=2161824 RepID=UPI000E1BBB51|nr:helix-turn-helix domain-containing protein [Alteripontixanthobacter maritimus]
MARFIHPDLADVPLAAALHALADPSRLNIVRRLDEDRRDGGAGLSCSDAACPELPRATMSNHYNILRAAGLVEARKDGVRVLHRLRRQAVDARFPELLNAVLAASA